MNEQQAKMMGFQSPGDQKIPVTLRDYNGLRLIAWRAKVAFEIIDRAASVIVERCKHSEGCPGIEKDQEPCLSSCPDRETRMDALVCLNAARMFSPIDSRKPSLQEVYIAPSREYYSEILGTLGALEVENERLRRLLSEAGVEPPPISPEPFALPSPLKELT